MKKIYFLGLVLSFFSSEIYSQDATFLNSNQSLVYFNPSFAGSNGGVRNQLSYSNVSSDQFSGCRTIINGFDAYVKALKGGVALSLLNDEGSRGTLITRELSFAYARHLRFLNNKLKIVPSVQVAYRTKTLSVQNLHFGDMIPRTEEVVLQNGQVPVPKKSFTDFSASLLVDYNNRFNAGLSVFHFTQPNEGMGGVYKLPYRLSGHVAYYLVSTQGLKLQSQYRIQTQSDLTSHQVSLNSILAGNLILGAGYIYYQNGVFHTNKVLANIGYRNNYFVLQATYSPIVTNIDLYDKFDIDLFDRFELSASFNLRDKASRRNLTIFENM